MIEGKREVKITAREASFLKRETDAIQNGGRKELGRTFFISYGRKKRRALFTTERGILHS